VLRVGALALLICSGLLLYLHASEKPGYQAATVTSVESVDSPHRVYAGGNPSDTPATPTEFAYNIGLKVDCAMYVGRYESATDYLPSAFKQQSSIDIRIAKHWLYVSLPMDHEVKLALMSHHALVGSACTR
jgi:hypothetical protein